jgi:enamine deaminase RidA (YjgF/YER057c/UK114 family)
MTAALPLATTPGLGYRGGVYRGIPRMSIKRLHVGPRMAQVVIHGGVAYLAGQVSQNATGQSVAAQTTDILATIDALLAEAGTDKSKVLTASIWLTDMSTFGEMNSVWDRWVSPGNTPARATVESPRLAAPGFNVEIAVTAAV